MRLIMITAAFCLSACATQPISSVDAKQISSEDIFAFGERPNTPHGTLTVTRDTGLTGAACTTRLTVDGTDAAYLNTGETVTLYVPEGERIIGALYGEAICAFGSVKEREIRISAGEAKRLRVSIDASGSLDISATSF